MASGFPILEAEIVQKDKANISEGRVQGLTSLVLFGTLRSLPCTLSEDQQVFLTEHKKQSLDWSSQAWLRAKLPYCTEDKECVSVSSNSAR